MTCPVYLLRGWPSHRWAVARAVDQVHPDAHSESVLGLPTPALTCVRWCVVLQDQVRGGGGGRRGDLTFS